MISSVNNYNNLAMLLRNPVSPADMNSAARTLYGSFVTAKYSSAINNIASREISGYLKSVNASINNLKTASDKLTAASKQSVMSERSAAVKDTNILTATASANATKKEYSIKVDNTAAAQVNTSSQLNASAFNSFTPGANTLKITAGGKTTDLSIDIKTYYTNRDALNTISDKINKANLGVKSTVIQDKNGNASLQLTGEKTGKDNAFTVTGELADQLTLTRTQEAADAKYSIDGKEYTSDTNNIKIDNGKVALTLKAAGETKLAIGDDTGKITDAVKNFAKTYNDTIDFLSSNTGGKAADQLRRELTNTMKFKKAGLESIGVQVGTDGRLTVDEDKLRTAASTNSERVRNALSVSTGAASRVSKTAEDALRKSPEAFLDQNVMQSDFRSSSFEDYYSYMSSAQKVYLNTKQQQGYLFDTFL